MILIPISAVTLIKYQQSLNWVTTPDSFCRFLVRPGAVTPPVATRKAASLAAAGPRLSGSLSDRMHQIAPRPVLPAVC